MKPLLLDILACPICKYFPLKLIILKWETSGSKFVKLLDAYRKKDLDVLKNATKIRRGKDKIEDGIIITQNENVLIRDQMVRKNTDIINYLKELESKFENFKVIEDHTEENYSSYLSLIKLDVIKRILDLKSNIINKNLKEIALDNQNKIIKDILPEIYALNWFFQFSEIEEGVIFCEKCTRWYPIMETIPQMLPDDLREKSNEINFLRKWKDTLLKEITEKGNPFNLNTK